MVKVCLTQSWWHACIHYNRGEVVLVSDEMGAKLVAVGAARLVGPSDPPASRAFPPGAAMDRELKIQNRVKK